MILRDSHGVRAIYHPCELCGTVRLVRLDGGKPRTLRCKKCARIGITCKTNKQLLEIEGRMYIPVDKTGPYAPLIEKSMYVRRARYVMAQVHGIDAVIGKTVHHVDRNKLNDDPDNLVLMTHSEHMQLHENWKHRWEERTQC